MYDKILKGIINEQSGETYTTEIDVFPHIRNVDLDIVDYPIKATVNWTLDIEARGWGLKNMAAYFTSEPLVLEFEVEEIEGDERTQMMRVEVDMAQVQINWEKGGFMAPVSLDLYLDAEGKVDYRMTTATFAYLGVD